jgi:ER-bound oxygenase mpaB/B'/Rubber oxygenase, catalytic domain
VPSKWSDDAFLDGLRRQGDPEADAAIAAVVAGGERQALGPALKHLRANDTPLPADAPPPLRAFMAASSGLSPGLDMARLNRGGAAFLKNGLPAVVVLLASSLPRGYAAPCLCEILSISRDLENRPFDRLMGVVQLLINISDADAFTPEGRAIVTAQKLRLLHAGVRRICEKYRPTYHERFGSPVNHEDMVATIMGFSYLLVDGLGRLGVPMEPGEAEDLYYLWRVFALLMGIHPDGRPHDDSYIPGTLGEAAEFYASYVRRTNTMPDKNPQGVVLTQDNLDMMVRMLPWPLRLMGFGLAPRMCMTELMRPDELARVGVAPLVGHRMLKTVLTFILRAGRRMGEREPFAASIARLLMQGMVDVDRGGRADFGVAFSRLGLRRRPFT